MGLKLYGIALDRLKKTTQRSSNAQTSRASLTKRQLHNLLPIPYDKIWQGLRFYECHVTRTRALYPGLGLYGSKNNNNKNIDLTPPIIFFFQFILRRVNFPVLCDLIPVKGEVSRKFAVISKPKNVCLSAKTKK